MPPPDAAGLPIRNVEKADLPQAGFPSIPSDVARK